MFCFFFAEKSLKKCQSNRCDTANYATKVSLAPCVVCDHREADQAESSKLSSWLFSFPVLSYMYEYSRVFCPESLASESAMKTTAACLGFVVMQIEFACNDWCDSSITISWSEFLQLLSCPFCHHWQTWTWKFFSSLRWRVWVIVSGCLRKCMFTLLSRMIELKWFKVLMNNTVYFMLVFIEIWKCPCYLYTMSIQSCIGTYCRDGTQPNVCRTTAVNSFP